jgi:hypothetical protein
MVLRSVSDGWMTDRKIMWRSDHDVIVSSREMISYGNSWEDLKDATSSELVLAYNLRFSEFIYLFIHLLRL